MTQTMVAPEVGNESFRVNLMLNGLASVKGVQCIHMLPHASIPATSFTVIGPVVYCMNAVTLDDGHRMWHTSEGAYLT
jgi:hypothetical protein